MPQFPENVKALCARRYRNQHRDWLSGGGIWPFEIPLGCPTEAEAEAQRGETGRWVAAWASWQGAGELVWGERQWRTLGFQKLPLRIILTEAAQVAAWIGEEQRWERARFRYLQWVSRWPQLAGGLSRHFDVLADYSQADILRLESIVSWLVANPQSNLYARQIPLPGMDTKWFEPRRSLSAELIAAIQGTDFETTCGLRSPPNLVRLRLLDEKLRAKAGGLMDVAAPIDQIAALQIPATRLYLVENLQTGLCFGDIPGSVLFTGLGRGVSALRQVPWLQDAAGVYWGDIDTHGFAILNDVRSFLPNVVSSLMDETTLLRHKDLWGQEPEQYASSDLPLLTPSERDVYQGLKQHRWGLGVRLEQERIPWNEAWNRIVYGTTGSQTALA